MLNKKYNILKLCFSLRGFTLIEILMTVLLIGILATISIGLIGSSTDEDKFNNTQVEMKQIRDAIIGNSDIRERGMRTSFGYLGDIGALPTAAFTLSALVTKPGALPAWAVDATVRFGLGWNGPYLSGGDSGTDYTTDGWGNAYVYSPTASPPTLVSLGSDGAVGGTVYAQDITITFPTEKRLANITGFISNAGAPFASDAEVELNYPDGAGALTQSLVVVAPADVGKFTYANIPFGIRSITIYVPTKAAPTKTVGPILITLDTPNVVLSGTNLDVGL